MEEEEDMVVEDLDLATGVQDPGAISVSYMETGNQTAISKFILLSLSEDMDLQPLLFGLFLSMYLVCVIGNLLTILAIISDSHLYSPTYFFLSNLSFTDMFQHHHSPQDVSEHPDAEQRHHV
ncbi:hypothetical protein E2I00_017231 [Balaenoptera physalus]|uniref:G-protein coupled receptors family 1 profile domain-containing protein n=1 Tax=Balaenoptera physalus TaxID=9770 RepID=A0A643C464_BALPH|nr:hypothetical protein E2I00_017231 [Balaenoptera physalus]